jgi:DNA-binding NarL/FixJ family response regulator
MIPSQGFIAVAVVEDDADLCTELQLLINEPDDMACVCVSRNARGALRAVPPCAPDVILMDVDLAGGSGLDCTACMKRLIPAAQIIMYTVAEEEDVVLRSLRNGASGYVLKSSRPEDLLRAIREVAAGGVPFSPTIARKVIHNFRREAPLLEQSEPLTLREEEILDFLSRGCQTKEIAEKLSISVATVMSHLKHIYEKMHVRSRTEAVIRYLAN